MTYILILQYFRKVCMIQSYQKEKDKNIVSYFKKLQGA